MIQRREQIAGLINARGEISFTELKKAFPNVSEMTLRRDLQYLDGLRQIVRTYGGAKSVKSLIYTEAPYQTRSSENPNAKRIIAQNAASLLKPGDIIFLDSGSTTTELAKLIPDGHFKLVTNSITCAAELARLKEAQIYVVGGQLNRSSMCLDGTTAVDLLGRINFTIAFFSVTGYGETEGFSTGELDELTLKRCVLQHSEKAVMLMDSSKTGVVSTFRFASLNEIHTIVSDGKLNDSFLQSCAAAGVTVL